MFNKGIKKMIIDSKSNINLSIAYLMNTGLPDSEVNKIQSHKFIFDEYRYSYTIIKCKICGAKCETKYFNSDIIFNYIDSSNKYVIRITSCKEEVMNKACL